MEVTLPWPPSTNTIWRRFGRRIIKSKRYTEFETNASAALAELTYSTLEGDVEVIIELYPPTRRRFDIDNYIKAVLDVLTQNRVWNDDSQVTVLHVAKGVCTDQGAAVVTINQVQTKGKR